MAGKHADVTEGVLRAFYAVYNGLGYGFLEKVYERAMVIELRKAGVKAVPQAEIVVLYDGQAVGEYQADLLVEDAVLVEVKATASLAPEHEAQLLNYLKATRYEVGLLLNFGRRRLEYRRVFRPKQLDDWKEHIAPYLWRPPE